MEVLIKGTSSSKDSRTNSIRAILLWAHLLTSTHLWFLRWMLVCTLLSTSCTPWAWTISRKVGLTTWTEVRRTTTSSPRICNTPSKICFWINPYRITPIDTTISISKSPTPRLSCQLTMRRDTWEKSSSIKRKALMCKVKHTIICLTTRSKICSRRLRGCSNQSGRSVIASLIV